MTPLIDIIFLLILFFVVVCQFIDTDTFPVQIPDKCDLAKEPQAAERRATLTAITGQDGKVEFTLGKNKIDAEKIQDEIDLALADVQPDERIVTLRIDKAINFGDVKRALASVSQSKAQYLHLAVLKEAGIEQNNSER